MTETQANQLTKLRRKASLAYNELDAVTRKVEQYEIQIDNIILRERQADD